MKMLFDKIRRIVPVVLLLLFAVAFLGSVGLFWKYVISEFLNQNTFGVPLEISSVYIVSSFVFVALLIALTAFGYILRNKYLTLVAFGYQILLILSLVLLVFLVNDQVTNMTLYNILLWVLMVLVAPIFGTVYLIGSWFIFLLLILFIATIVVLVLQFKKKK